MAGQDQGSEGRGDLSDIFISDAERDPVTAARREQKPVKPKRFYKEVALGETADGFQLLLDGRPARTPARQPLAAPSRRALALLIDLAVLGLLSQASSWALVLAMLLLAAFFKCDQPFLGPCVCSLG